MADNRQLGALLVLTGVALAVWSFGDRESDDKHEVREQITKVELGTDSGDVTIEVGDDDVTTVREKRSFWFIKRGDAYRVDGDTLHLSGDCGWNCEADFVVTVPRGTKVSGDSGSGDLKIAGVAGVDTESRSGQVEVRDVAGSVQVATTSGDVKLDRVDGALDVKVTSGDISGERLSGGPVRAATSSGDIKLVLDKAGSVTAEGTSSDIDVTVPDGSYQVSTDASSGDVDNSVPSVDGGTHKLDVRTTSGDITLRTS